LARNIRIVVGEGRTAQQGLLRFILEGEGFDVVGEAATVADLAISIAEGQPDVVVLDDGIGVMAVSMVHEALPQTKVVLVWPSSVVPPRS
jgi:AmiR/NasT family two-component response regulator